MMSRPMSRSSSGQMLSPAHTGSDSASAAGMFPPGAGMPGSMQAPMSGGGMTPNLAALQAADAQQRARQTQIRQAMLYHQQQQQQQAQLQQQQQQQHQIQQQAQQQQAQQQQAQQQQQQHHQQHQHQQQQHHHHQQVLQGRQTPVSMSMSPPQSQAQARMSPEQQQQIMQTQAAARQMSPPGSQSGNGMGMGVNNMGMNNSGQTQVPLGMLNQPGSMGMPMAGQAGQVSAGMNTVANAQTLQQIANAGPAAMAAYQTLQNPQHAMVQYLNQSMPGFSSLPILEQMRRWQVMQTNMQQRQHRNQIMPNQMIPNQMRPANAGASGSGPSQMQRPEQASQVVVAPQMMQQAQRPAAPGMSMHGQPAGMPAGMAGMQNQANLNSQQRQLYLLQMQQAQQMRNQAIVGGANAGAGAGMNPSMMNPQMLAVAQERARIEQQQRFQLAQRQGSPLNPAAGGGGATDQYPPGLRSNPPLPGIARSTRSPSVSAELGGGTPRIGGHGLLGQPSVGAGIGSGSDEYHRALMQAQRNAQLHNFMPGAGQG
ncbi:hypothetical protein EW145_g8463, partial [Phellinidium pouzarii]